jgi:xanthine dehydrogenase accessory factor
MKDVLDLVDAWRADGVDVGRAVVLRTYGSAPRPPGSVLLYSSDGRIAGNVSGGCVESAAAEEIDSARQAGRSRTVSYGISDEQAWGVGLACGGTIDVLIEPTVPSEAIEAARRADGVVVVTELPSNTNSTTTRRLTYDAGAGLNGTSGDAATDGLVAAAADEALLRGTSRVVEANDRQFFLEAFAVRPRLVIVGAVEIARPLVRLAHELGFETIVVDGRAAFATRERFPDADELLVGWFDEVAASIGLSRDDSVVVLAHDPKFDEPAIIEALRCGCRYVGAIGSKKTQAERRERLRHIGVSESDVARLHGPIGLDLGGRAPAETALAILAEVVASRYSASGASLRDVAANKPLHAT